jgi:two-component system, LytTR family, response regulator
MSKYSVLIADDEKLSREAVKLQLKNHEQFEIVAECKNGRETLTQIVEQKPDIIFLDIQMPYMTGLEVLKQLEHEYSPAIIIISAYDNYALKAFEIDAIDYLVKPFTDDRFQKALDKALKSRNRGHDQLLSDKNSLVELQHLMKKMLQDEQTAALSIKDNTKISVVQTSDIIYIEAAGNYVTVFTTNKKYLHKDTLQSLEENLPSFFIRIHKSVIVNSTHIMEFHSLFNGDYLVKLNTGHEVRLSRNYRKNVEHLLS